MSCGLGAIVLVFMLVKHNVDNSVLETDLLEGELQELRKEESFLRDQISKIESEKVSIASKIGSASVKIEQIRAAAARVEGEISSLKNKKISLEASIKTTAIPKKPDAIEDPQIGEESYIIGLRVEGRKIGILVDGSSSMTDEILIDIIRRKNSSAANKRLGPKWQRTKRIVKWLIARVPEKSDVSVVSFSNKTTHLGGKGWKRGSNANALGRILSDLNKYVPEGSTNLQAGLKAISVQKPTDIYIVTDGLPTDGSSNFRSLNPFASCSSLWSASTTISGECRAKLFRHTINSGSLPGVKVNVILLPIEGDPEAANEFWRWTASTNGLLMNPAASWP